MDPLILYPALVPFLLALVLALHHYYVHSKPNDHAQDESCAVCCYLQPSDMRNHEIWVVSLLCIAATWTLAGNVFQC